MLPIDGIHVWRIDLDAGAQKIRKLEKLLSAQEQDRAARFRQTLHRDRFVISHGAVREILGRYLDLPPASIEFRLSREGKPSIEQTGDHVCTSISPTPIPSLFSQ